MKEQLMSVEELADYFNVKQQCIYNWIREKDRYKLPAIKMGRVWRFRKEDIELWTKDNEVK